MGSGPASVPLKGHVNHQRYPLQQDVQIRQAKAEDADALLRLLRQAALPTEGLIEALPHALVCIEGGAVLGGAALEIWPPYGLLRSVVVAPEAQGRGLARRLVQAMTNLAAENALSDVFLLTTTAAGYFARLGFAAVERTHVPSQIQQTSEFSTLCPSSAVVMVRAIGAPYSTT